MRISPCVTTTSLLALLWNYGTWTIPQGLERLATSPQETPKKRRAMFIWAETQAACLKRKYRFSLFVGRCEKAGRSILLLMVPRPDVVLQMNTNNRHEPAVMAENCSWQTHLLPQSPSCTMTRSSLVILGESSQFWWKLLMPWVHREKKKYAAPHFILNKSILASFDGLHWQSEKIWLISCLNHKPTAVTHLGLLVPLRPTSTVHWWTDGCSDLFHWPRGIQKMMLVYVCLPSGLFQ